MDGLTSFIVLVALTTGITEVCKRALSLESKFMPLVALISGLGLTFIGNVQFSFTALVHVLCSQVLIPETFEIENFELAVYPVE